MYVLCSSSIVSSLIIAVVATYTPVLEAWNNVLAHLDVIIR